MSDPRFYEHNTFVLLEANQPEQFLTAEEMLQKLTEVLQPLQTDLPRDLQKFSTIAEQAQHLLDTACELDLGPGQYFQWYAVRLEK
jgi:Protein CHLORORESPIRATORY REDUCTION 7